jgi:hypothetical protein
MDPQGRGPATASLSIEIAALDWNGRYAHSFPCRGRPGMPASGRTDAFAVPFGTDRYLREAAVADRGLGRLNREARLQGSRREQPESAGDRAFGVNPVSPHLRPRRLSRSIARLVKLPRRSSAFPASAKSLRAQARGRRALRWDGRSIGRASPATAPRAVRNCAYPAASRRR